MKLEMKHHRHSLMIVKYSLRFLKNCIKRIFYFLTWDQWANLSWSQEGEDMVLRRIFEKNKHGFYVDVGAHHPKRFSNTFLFYRKGWSGINIDAMPGSMRLFKKQRPRDLNLELGVAQETGSLDYYVFNEPALNGFSKQISESRENADNNYFVSKVIKVDVSPLSEVLNNHLDGRKIDFLTVDVEGLDLEVLKSNDWNKYRPRFVLAEILNSSLHEIERNELVQFMRSNGYAPYCKQVNTVFFQDLTE